MSAKEPLAQALARAATRYVSESKVGARRGSVTAVAKAMTERGVDISSNTLNRKLTGDYPLNSDEIGALAAVLGVDPDAIWRDALRIMRDAPAPDPEAIAEDALSQLPAASREAIRRVGEDLRPKFTGDNGNSRSQGA